jgi:hypothetical protein
VNDDERRTAFAGEGIHDIVVWKEVKCNNSVVCMYPLGIVLVRYGDGLQGEAMPRKGFRVASRLGD